MEGALHDVIIMIPYVTYAKTRLKIAIVKEGGERNNESRMDLIGMVLMKSYIHFKQQN
jgi:hypothetical protein